MNPRLLVALLTALGFAAGFGARMLTESGPAVPPPPTLGQEFVRSGTATPGHDNKERRAPTYTDKDRSRLIADVAKIRPQIDLYRQRIDQIAAEFERDLVPVLTPEQKEKFTAMQKRDAERRAKGEQSVAQAVTLSDEQIFRLQQRPLWNALWNVAISWREGMLDRELKLDDAQEAKVRELLEQRRRKFLDLVDSTPPPSITLSELAPQAAKLIAPGQSAEPPHGSEPAHPDKPKK